MNELARSSEEGVQECPIQYSVGSPGHGNQAREKIKGIYIGRKKSQTTSVYRRHDPVSRKNHSLGPKAPEAN